MNTSGQMTEAYEWQERQVVGRDGEKIGKVDQIYLDEATGQPEWASVHTGLFGMKSNFVPLRGAHPVGEDVQVEYTKDEVGNAPGITPDAELSTEEEQRLWSHYGMDYEYDDSSTADDTTFSEGEDVSGPETDSAMTRSEEEVRVGKREREAGRARLRKYVVTEQVTQTVPVQKEKAVLEHEPITEGNVDAATSGPAISDEEHEVVLNEEEVVVEKKAVPKERVRLGKETETSEERVSEEVRKEQIEVEGDIRR
jgi:uncharacterized protein (TIGR02271 family)